MNSFRNRFAILAVLVLACAFPGFVSAENEKPKKDDKKEAKSEKSDKSDKGDKKKGDKNAKKSDEEGKMTVPLPVGHDAKRLTIPYRDDEGKLQMKFVMEIGKRIDPDHMLMTKLIIETFGADEKPEMTIDLPDSTLDLNTRVITTQTGVTIKRADFELTGKTMEFNTQTKQGSVGGKVRMLIYNLSNETDDQPEAPREK